MPLRDATTLLCLALATIAAASCNLALTSSSRCGPDNECSPGAICRNGACDVLGDGLSAEDAGAVAADGGGALDDAGDALDDAGDGGDAGDVPDDGGPAGDDGGALDAGPLGADAGDDAGPWHVPGALHRVRVTFDDGSVDAPLHDVPVLVEPSATMLMGMRSDGLDIVAVDQDGSPLAIDLEGFSGSVPRAIWLRVPDLPADTAGRWCWLYYGGPVAPTTPGASVWTRYGAVWHGDGTSEVDRTGTQAPPACVGDCPAIVTGRIGRAWSFAAQGPAGYLNVTDDDALDVDDGEARTISLWLKVPQGNTDRALVWKENSCRGWIIQLDADGDLHGRLSTNPTADGVCTAAENADVETALRVDDNQWHHATFVVDRALGVLVLYVDGVRHSDSPATSDLSADGLPLLVGANWNAALRMTGLVDELRVSSFAETDAWVKAQYRSMIGQLAAIGAVEDAY